MHKISGKDDFEVAIEEGATLETGLGNDYDQASLLLSLLRSSGIPSRYVRGQADIPVSQILEWLDLTDPASANSILNSAGIQATPIVDGTGNITVYRVDRVWVAAHVPYGNYRSSGSDTSGSLWVPLDPALKLKGREGKYIFKKALEPVLPKEILFRDKMGFAVPLASWFRGPLKEKIRNTILSEKMLDSGLFNSRYLEKLISQHQAGLRDYSASLWTLLMFASFLRSE